MEDKIEVGEYVRSNGGLIIKTDWIGNSIVTSEDSKTISKHDIVKHSKNIIDLIEVGDYVNGMEVYKGNVANGKEKLLVGDHIINGMALEIVNIKSIVTKEQFKSVKYEVER